MPTFALDFYGGIWQTHRLHTKFEFAIVEIIKVPSILRCSSSCNLQRHCFLFNVLWSCDWQMAVVFTKNYIFIQVYVGWVLKFLYQMLKGPPLCHSVLNKPLCSLAIGYTKMLKIPQDAQLWLSIICHLCTGLVDYSHSVSTGFLAATYAKVRMQWWGKYAFSILKFNSEHVQHQNVSNHKQHEYTDS